MSQQLNQSFQQWKVVEGHLRRTPFVYRGHPMSQRDSATWACCLLLQGMLTVDLAFGDSPTSSFRMAKQWCYTMAKLDAHEVATSLKRFNSELKAYFHRACEQGPESYDAFKQRLSDLCPWIGAVMAPTKGLVGQFLQDCSPSSFAPLNQFSSFITKVSLRDIDLADEAIDKFIEIDESLPDSFPPDVLSGLNQIMRRWLDGLVFDETNLIPSHGPGGVAEVGRTGQLQKYKLLGCDELLEYVLRKHNCFPEDYIPVKDRSFDRVSRLQIVPKSTTTVRTICMEPATMQYFQQAVLRVVDKFIMRAWPLKRHVSLHDQSVNFSAAREGSLFGELATIDLSSASDCVSWELVRKVFTGTSILPWMYATRSRSIQVREGEILPARKFAPMGSALCFPTECLIFAAACEYIFQKRRIRRSHRFHVYGDDIVIPTDLATDLMDLLGTLGFSVNSDKSYYHQDTVCFRESCGGEFVAGTDVTPVRLSRNFSSFDKGYDHPEVIEGYLEAANAAHSKYLLLTRSWFIHNLMSLPRQLRPVFGDGCHQIHSTQPTNFHLIVRWNRALQRSEGKTFSFDARTRKVEAIEENELIRYLHWMLQAEICPDRSGFDSTPIETNLSRPYSKLRSRFVRI